MPMNSVCKKLPVVDAVEGDTVVKAKRMDGSPEQGKPFKVTEVTRATRKGVVANSLEELISKVGVKFENLRTPVTIVLEVDGTEIDDEEYFNTLEPGTCLMVLQDEEKWEPEVPSSKLSIDVVDGDSTNAELAGLVDKLKKNYYKVSLLGDVELELLSDMDPDSLADITYSDKIFLEQLKEASGRYLSEKREADDALELLRLYHDKEIENESPLTTE